MSFGVYISWLIVFKPTINWQNDSNPNWTWCFRSCHSDLDACASDILFSSIVFADWATCFSLSNFCSSSNASRSFSEMDFSNWINRERNNWPIALIFTYFLMPINWNAKWGIGSEAVVKMPNICSFQCTYSYPESTLHRGK